LKDSPLTAVDTRSRQKIAARFLKWFHQSSGGAHVYTSARAKRGGTQFSVRITANKLSADISTRTHFCLHLDGDLIE
jgi:hypothetical protein